MKLTMRYQHILVRVPQGYYSLSSKSGPIKELTEPISGLQNKPLIRQVVVLAIPGISAHLFKQHEVPVLMLCHPIQRSSVWQAGQRCHLACCQWRTTVNQLHHCILAEM